MGRRSSIGLILSATLIFFCVLISVPANACTGILIKTQDNNYIFGRTMEFAFDYIAHVLIFVPRNYQYTGHAPSGKPGLAWKTKYAQVGFAAPSLPLVDDGLNEQGLYCGAFFQPGFAKYEEVTEKDYPRTISCLDLASWILSTCANVAEVREQLPKIRVCAAVLPELGFVPPTHYFVADKTGDAIVIEYLEGKLNIYDSQANVITNSPNYLWHTTNLRNYIGLKAENNPPMKLNGKEFSQIGQGSGALGLPGDFTPPSRFVKAAFLANAALPGKDVSEGIGIIFHIMNQFDIPQGAIKGEEAGKVTFDTVQWTSASDLSNARYYYHTYNDRNVRMIDLNKLDLNAADVKSIKDVQAPGNIRDVSDQLAPSR